jgi:hypothetical protein
MPKLLQHLRMASCALLLAACAPPSQPAKAPIALDVVGVMHSSIL